MGYLCVARHDTRSRGQTSVESSRHGNRCAGRAQSAWPHRELASLLGYGRNMSAEFQSRSSRQGQAFEAQARSYLEALDYTLHGKKVLADIGCSVDDEATSPCGIRVYFEYKGSFQGPKPGMRRTDTVKKALLTGFLLRSIGDDTPYVVLTSHLPTGGAALKMIEASRRAGAVSDVLVINEPGSTEALTHSHRTPADPRATE